MMNDSDPDVAESHPLRTQHRAGEHLAILNATKIGGVNTPIPEYDRLPGRFLAQIASLFTTHARYPLLNVASFDELASNEQDVLTFGDLGGLFLFVEQTGFFRKRSHLRWIVTSG